MILICTANVVAECIRTQSRHDKSAATKPTICRVCVAAMNHNPSLREKYNASVLKGVEDGEPRQGQRVRK